MAEHSVNPQWANLTHFDVSFNRLSGTIAGSLGSSPSLSTLTLSNNRFVGWDAGAMLLAAHAAGGDGTRFVPRLPAIRAIDLSDNDLRTIVFTARVRSPGLVESFPVILPLDSINGSDPDGGAKADSDSAAADASGESGGGGADAASVAVTVAVLALNVCTLALLLRLYARETWTKVSKMTDALNRRVRRRRGTKSPIGPGPSYCQGRC